MSSGRQFELRHADVGVEPCASYSLIETTKLLGHWLTHRSDWTHGSRVSLVTYECNKKRRFAHKDVLAAFAMLHGTRNRVFFLVDELIVVVLKHT